MGARTSLGKFAKSAGSHDLRRGLAHYTRTGLGGARAATQRMGRTVDTAGRLYRVLQDLRSGAATPAELAIDKAALVGRSAREIADVIANALQPADGPQDAEAARDAISQALSDLMLAYPDVNLLALAPEQIDQVVEGYVAHDLCHRIELDVGLSILSKAPTAA